MLRNRVGVAISKLKNEELDKVKKLNPSKYIFVTSKKLSRINKQEIINILEKAGIKNYSLKWKWAFRWQVIIETY